jgi:hypothetical protein
MFLILSGEEKKGTPQYKQYFGRFNRGHAICPARSHAPVCAFFLFHNAHNLRALRNGAAGHIPKNPPSKRNRVHNRPKTNVLRAKYNRDSGKAVAELLGAAAAAMAN